MGLPVKKSTKSRKRKRTYTQRLKGVSLSNCPKCSKPILPHRACKFCGTYKNKEVLRIKFKKKKGRKRKEKEEKSKT